MNHLYDNNIDSANNDTSQRTSLKSDANEIKKNRRIISDYFRLINSKKNLNHENIKYESINFLNSLNRDITQIFDHDKNNCIFNLFTQSLLYLKKFKNNFNKIFII